MTKTYYLDKRIMPSGKNGQLNLDNVLNLQYYIQQVTQPIINTSYNDINNIINQLSNIIIVKNSYAAIASDYRILVNQIIAGTITINLPTALGNSGKTYFIQIINNTSPVSVTVDGIELINGSTSILLKNKYEYIEVVSANDQWYIVNSNYTL